MADRVTEAVDAAFNDVSEPSTSQQPTERSQGGFSQSEVSEAVARVIDGDTVETQEGERVRLTGFDTPERAPFEGGSRQATDFLRENISEAESQESQGTGHFGRELRRVERGGENIGNQLIRAGLAEPTLDSDESAEEAVAQRSARRAFGIETDTEREVQRERERLNEAGLGQEIPTASVDRALEDERGTFSRSFDRGVDNLRLAAGAATETIGDEFGIDAASEFGRDMMTDAFLDVQLNPREVEDFTEIGEIEGPLADVGTWVTQVLGENIPNFASIGAGAIAGAAGGSLTAAGGAALAGKSFLKNLFKQSAKKRAAKELAEGPLGGGKSKLLPGTASSRGAAAGAFGATFPQHLGQLSLELQQAGVDPNEAEDIWWKATLASTVETGGAGLILGTAMRGLNRGAAKNLVQQNINEATRKGVFRKVAEQTGRGFAEGAGIEAPIEAGHELLYMTARANHDPNFSIDFDDPKVTDRLTEAVLAGGTVGGILGGGGRGLTTTVRELMRPSQQSTATPASNVDEDVLADARAAGREGADFVTGQEGPAVDTGRQDRQAQERQRQRDAEFAADARGLPSDTQTSETQSGGTSRAQQTGAATAAAATAVAPQDTPSANVQQTEETEETTEETQQVNVADAIDRALDQAEEADNAQEVRGNQGQSQTQGQERSRGQEGRRQNVQREQEAQPETRDQQAELSEQQAQTTPVRRVISGGQTGADRGGLEAARNLGIETGGHAPKGFRTDAGDDSALGQTFGLEEDRSRGYAARTRRNVENSDGTVVFQRRSSAGSKLTTQTAEQKDKPFTVIDTIDEDTAVRQLRDFVNDQGVETLNVAGHRESSIPGIADFTQRVVERALSEQPQQTQQTRRDSVPNFEDVQTVTMRFKMPRRGLREELRSRYPDGTTTQQLMEDGFRVATTRSRRIGRPGSFFKTREGGPVYRVIGHRQLPDDLDQNTEFQESWSRLEGWNFDFARQRHSQQVAPGKWQTIFERVDQRDNDSQQGSRATQQTQDNPATQQTRRELQARMRAQGFSLRQAQNMTIPQMQQALAAQEPPRSGATSQQQGGRSAQQGGTAPVAAQQGAVATESELQDADQGVEVGAPGQGTAIESGERLPLDPIELPLTTVTKEGRTRALGQSTKDKVRRNVRRMRDAIASASQQQISISLREEGDRMFVDVEMPPPQALDATPGLESSTVRQLIEGAYNAELKRSNDTSARNRVRFNNETGQPVNFDVPTATALGATVQGRSFSDVSHGDDARRTLLEGLTWMRDALQLRVSEGTSSFKTKQTQKRRRVPKIANNALVKPVEGGGTEWQGGPKLRSRPPVESWAEQIQARFEALSSQKEARELISELLRNGHLTADQARGFRRPQGKPATSESRKNRDPGHTRELSPREQQARDLFNVLVDNQNQLEGRDSGITFDRGPQKKDPDFARAKQQRELELKLQDAAIRRRQKRERARQRAAEGEQWYLNSNAPEIRQQLNQMLQDGIVTREQAERLRKPGNKNTDGRRAKAQEFRQILESQNQQDRAQETDLPGGTQRADSSTPVFERREGVANDTGAGTLFFDQREDDAPDDTGDQRSAPDDSNRSFNVNINQTERDLNRLNHDTNEFVGTGVFDDRDAQGGAIPRDQRDAADPNVPERPEPAQSPRQQSALLQIPQVARPAIELTRQTAEAFNRILEAVGVRLEANPIVLDSRAGLQQLVRQLDEAGVLNQGSNRTNLQALYRDDPVGRTVWLRDGNIVRPLVYINQRAGSQARRNRVALHELGHVVLRHTVQNTPENVLQQLEQIVGPRDDMLMFEENFADLFMRWSEGISSGVQTDRVGRQVSETVREFFRDLWRKMRRFFRRFQGELPTNQSFADFMEMLMNRTRERREERMISSAEMRTEWGRRANEMLQQNGFDNSTVIKYDSAWAENLNWQVWPERRNAHVRAARKKAEDLLSKFSDSKPARVARTLDSGWSRVGRALDQVMRRDIVNPQTGNPNRFTQWVADQFRKVPGVAERIDPNTTSTHQARQLTGTFMKRMEDMLDPIDAVYTRMDDETVQARLRALRDDGVLNEERYQYYAELPGEKNTTARAQRGRELRREIGEAGERQVPQIQPWHLFPEWVLNTVGAQRPEPSAVMQEASTALIEGRPLEQVQSAQARELTRQFRQLYRDMWDEAKKMGLEMGFRDDHFPVVYSAARAHDKGRAWFQEKVREWVRENPEAAQQWFNQVTTPGVRNTTNRDNLSSSERQRLQDRPNNPFTEAEQQNLADYLFNVFTHQEGVFNPTQNRQDGDFETGQFLGDFAGPGFQWRKARNLPDSLHAKLTDVREQDVMNVTAAYTRKLFERATLQQRFALNEEIASIERSYEKARRLRARAQQARGSTVDEFLQNNPEFQDVFDSAARRQQQQGGRRPTMADLVGHGFELAQEYRADREQHYQDKFGVNLYDPMGFVKVRLQEEVDAGRMQDSDARRVAQDLIPQYLGTKGADTSPAWRRAQQAMMVYQGVRVLSLSVFAQFVDVSLVMARTAPGYRQEIVPLLRDMMRDSGVNEQGHATGFRGMQEVARIMGLVQRDMTEHLLNDNMGMMMPYEKLGQINQLFFRYNGMHMMTNFMRTVSSNLGARLLQSYARDGRDDLLAELNVTREQVHEWEADGMPVDLTGEGSKHEAVIGAIHQFTDESVIFPDPSVRPAIGNDRRTAVLWHLKSFVWGYQMQVLQRVANQSRTRWGENEGMRRLAAAGPMIALGAFSLPLAMLGMEMRWLISDPNRRPSTGSPEYYFEAAQRSGMTGIAQLLIDADAAEKYGRVGLIAIAGPTASHAEEFIRDGLPPTQSFVERSLPAYPIALAARDALTGEDS